MPPPRGAVWPCWWGSCWLIAGAVEAQTSVPGAPTINTVTAGSNTSGLTLVVTWTAPTSDGGSAITAYDVRHIETADDETDDANWTVERRRLDYRRRHPDLHHLRAA